MDMDGSGRACCIGGAGGVLFAVDSSGRVFSLTLGSAWKELPYLGIEFKRVSAAGRNFLWGIGGDHQVYVFVFGIEIPIRVKETTYENQRWNPMGGFCDNLLPTDRPKFSSVDGMIARPKNSVTCPTMAWQWESDWHLETVFNGHKLDDDGWTYAVDFPADYHPKKSFTSCVRRRKWVRFRRYVAVESWSAIPAIHKDMCQEPFIDIAVGGHELPNGDPDELFVWTVTVLGRVLVRQGVTVNNPEGSGWIHIRTPDRAEVSQITVGPSGLVWAVTWQGKALVRLGISRIDPTGNTWCEVDSPDPKGAHLSHVALGENTLWALSRDRRVWFRNGIRGSGAGDNETLAKGSKWIEMVGELHMISVGPGDQVLGITDDDRSVVFRTGVIPSDLSGKTWKNLTISAYKRTESINIPKTTERRRSLSQNLSESPKGSQSATPRGTPVRTITEGSSNANFKKKATEAGNTIVKEVIANTATGILSRVPIVGPPAAMVARQVIREELSDLKIFDPESPPPAEKIDESMYQSALESSPQEGEEKEEDDDEDKVSLASTIVVDREDQYNVTIVDNITENNPVWVWLTSGTCRIDPNSPPISWFQETTASVNASLAGEPWRVDILQSLKKNNEIYKDKQFKSYDSAVERASWVKKGQAKINTCGTKWENCTIELEQTGSHHGGVEFGTLSIFGSKKVKEHLSLTDITCVCQMGDKTLSIHTPSRTSSLSPIQLKFSGDLEKEVWHAQLIAGMNSVRGTTGVPSPGSVFSVTSCGEVCVFDPKAAEESGCEERTVESTGYSQKLPLTGKDLPVSHRLENGFSNGSVIFCILKLKDDASTFSVNLTTGGSGDYLTHNCNVVVHFNPRLEENKVVCNYFQQGSGWGTEEYKPVIMMTEDGEAMKAFSPGHTAQILIKSEPSYFQIIVNGHKFARFKSKISSDEISHVQIQGDVDIHSVVYHSKSVILPPNEMYWRVLGGGHFLQVESCSVGVVWAIGYDFTSWVYTGGWGGAHFNSSNNVHTIQDTKYFYIYENQRWNPLTGFTAHGLLPTDRYAWSDKTGRISMTKESVKAPSIHWQWVSDWMVNYDTPGGVDKDGWQYATDFPATYHGKAGAAFTYVRRRRWVRKCRLTTTGPWKKLGATKLLDISMIANEGAPTATVWAVATNGDALYRTAVSSYTPEGQDWLHVSSDIPFQSISVGGNRKVWAVGKDGSAYLRHGISDAAPTGQVWLQVHQPNDTSPLRSISASSTRNGNRVWAVDVKNKLYFRQEVTSVFPEGTCWSATVGSEGVKSISAVSDSEMWGILDSVNLGGGRVIYDVLSRRSGMTPNELKGTGWDFAIGPGWKYASVRGKDPKF